MSNPEIANQTSTDQEMSIILYVASALVLSSGALLFVLSESTDTYFAWTINPPLTAAFLGAGYWASFVLEFLSAREKKWERARLAVPSVEVFTILTLIVTLIHLDRFHTESPNLVTLIITWVWIIVYITVPVILGILLINQFRKRQPEPSILFPLSTSVRIILGLQGITMLSVGASMLLFSDFMIPLWPWTLSILTSRAIGAWGVGIGIIALHALWENDWTRLSPTMLGYALYGLLQLINLIRFPGTLEWDHISTIVYTSFMISILVIGVYGIRQTRNIANVN
jgi:hypothetical protein